MVDNNYWRILFSGLGLGSIKRVLTVLSSSLLSVLLLLNFQDQDQDQDQGTSLSLSINHGYKYTQLNHLNNNSYEID